MLTVGLTGNIASGKSTVVEVWRGLGARIVDADELARRAVEPGSPALREIVDRWGSGMLTPEGALDRAAMRELVFADKAARAALEGIVHPLVAELREQEFAAATREGVPVVVADIPLLFEVGREGEFDLVVLVEAPERIRRDRIFRNRGIDPAEADRMIAAQMPSSAKRPRSNFVIDNDGSMEQLRQRAGEVWKEILRRADAGV